MPEAPINISISKQQVAEFPVETFQGAITVIESPADAADALGRLAGEDVVGFDTETKPNFRKGKTNTVSLIQISTADHAYLFRLNKMGFTPELRQFMEAGHPIKVGLSLKDDFHVLHQIAQFDPEGFIDLQTTVKQYCITDASLQKIYAILFQRRISKAQRLTNWEAAKLTTAQMLYASLDAWACLRIFRLFQRGGFDPTASPYIIKPDQES